METKKYLVQMSVFVRANMCFPLSVMMLPSHHERVSRFTAHAHDANVDISRV